MTSSTGNTGPGSTRAAICSNLLGYLGCSRLQQYATRREAKKGGLFLQKACGHGIVGSQEVVPYSVGGGESGRRGSWGRMQVWCRCGQGGWSGCDNEDRKDSA